MHPISPMGLTQSMNCFTLALDSAHVASDGLAVAASARDIMLPAQAAGRADGAAGNPGPVS